MEKYGLKILVVTLIAFFISRLLYKKKLDVKIENLFNNFDIWILVAIFSLAYIILTVYIRHLHFLSTAFDLGIFDQAIWQLSQFKSPINTVRELNIFSDHFSPILVLIAPLYWVFNDVSGLLILQSIITVLGMAPIYWIALNETKNKSFALIIAISYVYFIGIQDALEFDFACSKNCC